MHAVGPGRRVLEHHADGVVDLRERNESHAGFEPHQHIAQANSATVAPIAGHEGYAASWLEHRMAAATENRILS